MSVSEMLGRNCLDLYTQHAGEDNDDDCELHGEVQLYICIP